MKSQLQDNVTEIYSTQNEGKFVVAERFAGVVNNKIYKYKTSISKNGYIEELEEKVDKFNNTSHRTFNMKPIDVKTSTVFDFEVENNDKNVNYKVGDHLRISKESTLKWSEEVSVIKQVKNAVPWTYAIIDLNSGNIARTFNEKELQKNKSNTISDDKKVTDYM